MTYSATTRAGRQQFSATTTIKPNIVTKQHCREKGTPNQHLACFTHYLKIINFFFFFEK